MTIYIMIKKFYYLFILYICKNYEFIYKIIIKILLKTKNFCNK